MSIETIKNKIRENKVLLTGLWIFSLINIILNSVTPLNMRDSVTEETMNFLVGELIILFIFIITSWIKDKNKWIQLLALFTFFIVGNPLFWNIIGYNYPELVPNGPGLGANIYFFILIFNSIFFIFPLWLLTFSKIREDFKKLAYLFSFNFLIFSFSVFSFLFYSYLIDGKSIEFLGDDTDYQFLSFLGFLIFSILEIILLTSLVFARKKTEKKLKSVFIGNVVFLGISLFLTSLIFLGMLASAYF